MSRPEGSERSCRFWWKGFLASEISSAEVLRSIQCVLGPKEANVAGSGTEGER